MSRHQQTRWNALSLVALIGILTLFAAPVPPQSPLLPREATPEATPEPTPPPAEQLEALEEEIEAAESAATPATAERLGITEERLNERAARLRSLASTLRQQINLQERLEELERAREDLEKEIEAWRENGGAEAGPPTMRLADKLRDEADTARRQTGNLELSLEIAEEEHEQALERLKEAQRERREAAEAAESAEDPQQRARLQWERGRAELEERLAEAEAANRRLRKEATELELANSRERQAFLEERAEAIAARVQFTRQELEEQISEADMKRDAVERSLAQLRDTHRANDARRDEAREALDAARGEEQLARRTAELAARTAWADTSARVLELAERRLELHRTERLLWERRYLVAQGKTDEELGEWLAETERFLEELQRDRKVQESRLLDLKANIASLQRQREGAEATYERQAMETRLNALRARESRINDYLAELIPLERLAERLTGEIERERTQVTLSEHLARVQRFAAKAWDFELLEWGGESITLKKIVIALAVLILGMILAAKVSRGLRRQIMARGRVNENSAAAIEKTLFYLGVFLVVIFALNVVNIPLTLFAFLGGALAIAIGFGAQHIINNFISGIILMIERPIRIGDLVEVDGHYGHIQEIGARSTRLKTASNIHLLIPNSKLLENTVINWTLSDERVRVYLTVGVLYGSPTREVERILRQVTAEEKRVLKTPAPVILFKEFGDNALIFELHFWVHLRRPMDEWIVSSALRFRIDELFREANIVIAFPQRDVHLDSLSPIQVEMVEKTHSRPYTPPAPEKPS